MLDHSQASLFIYTPNDYRKISKSKVVKILFVIFVDILIEAIEMGLLPSNYNTAYLGTNTYYT